MLVFWEQRLVILAPPKTGSTALAAALSAKSALQFQRPPVLKHTTVRRFHRFIGPYLETASGEKFEVAALMREPIDWLASWYRFRSRDDVEPAKSTKGLTFDEFVRAYTLENQPAYAAVGAQSQFLQPRNGQGVDYLYRYEDMPSFVDFLENKLNINIQLSHLNISPPIEAVLSLETRKIARHTLHAEFSLYDSIR